MVEKSGEKLYLVEHFFSIQGEGKYAGVPSVFLRFGGCNLRCPGFGSYELEEKKIYGCDTLRAVYSNLYRRSWHSVADISELERIVRKYENRISYLPDIVITGGEPMIYADNSLFCSMLELLAERGHRITIETNATIAPPLKRYEIYKEITFAMAVKLSCSGEQKNRRVVPKAIEAIATMTKNSFFKFTLDRELVQKDGAKQIAEICEGYDNEIYCMPLGGSEEELRKNAPAVAKFCISHGYRYSDRLHVRLWNREEKR